MQVHEIAEAFNLNHESIGTDKNRQIFISKKYNNKSSKNLTNKKFDDIGTVDCNNNSDFSINSDDDNCKLL